MAASPAPVSPLYGAAQAPLTGLAKSLNTAVLVVLGLLPLGILAGIVLIIKKSIKK